MILTNHPPRNVRSTNPFDDLLVEQDRRRQGRRAASPTLISLLRGTTGSADADPDETAADSSLTNGSNFGRCILFTLLLALPFWGGIGAVCYWLTR